MPPPRMTYFDAFILFIPHRDCGQFSPANCLPKLRLKTFALYLHLTGIVEVCSNACSSRQFTGDDFGHGRFNPAAIDGRGGQASPRRGTVGREALPTPAREGFPRS